MAEPDRRRRQRQRRRDRRGRARGGRGDGQGRRRRHRLLTRRQGCRRPPRPAHQHLTARRVLRRGPRHAAGDARPDRRGPPSRCRRRHRLPARAGRELRGAAAAAPPRGRRRVPPAHPQARARRRRHPVRVQVLPPRDRPDPSPACAPPASPSTSSCSPRCSGPAGRSSSSPSPGPTPPVRPSTPSATAWRASAPSSTSAGAAAVTGSRALRPARPPRGLPGSLVLNWRDVQHPQAGGAEQYMHQIARRWVEVGARVTWLTARGPGQSPRAVIDGIEVVRAGGALGIYPRAALAAAAPFRPDRLRRRLPERHPVLLAAVRRARRAGRAGRAPRAPGPVRACGSARCSPPWAASSRARGTRVVYKDAPIAAVSPSTRQELRRRLRLPRPDPHRAQRQLAPPEVRSPRDPEPTITVVTRLVPHKRVDVLLAQLAITASAVPKLRVDIVGDGPERIRPHGCSPPSWGSATSSPSTATSPTRSVTSWCAAPG